MMQQTGKIMIIAGLVLLVAGLIIYFAGNKLGWLGHLPGDIRIERDNFKLYIPITTMLLISIILSLIIYLIRKIF